MTKTVIAVMTAAKRMCPMPRARPTAIAKKTLEISLELPAMERKRMREKAPRMAMEVPREPLTMSITTSTRSGRMVKVMRKLREVLLVLRWVKAMTRPRARATPEQIRMVVIFSPEAEVSKTLLNIDLIPFFD